MSTTKPEKTTLPLDHIKTDGGTQPRAGLLDYEVEDYAEQLRAGATFPPVEVVYDGTQYWLTDGFHRVEAYKRAEMTEIAAKVTQGTREDAVWHSFAANRTNGIKRSPDDRKRAVLGTLTHPNRQQMTRRQLASHCGVSVPELQRWQKQFQEQGLLPERDPEPAAAPADSPPPAPTDLGDEDDLDEPEPAAAPADSPPPAPALTDPGDVAPLPEAEPEPVFTPTLPADLVEAGWELHQTGDTAWQAVHPDLDMHTQPTSDPVALIDATRELAASVGMAPPPDDDKDDEPEPVAEPVAEPEAAAPPADYTAGGQPVSGEAAVGTVASFAQMLYTVASERWEAVSLSEQEPDEVYPVDYEQSHAIAAQM